MPVIKSAIKKMRQDEKRRAKNKAKKEAIKEALKKARKNPTPQNLSLAYSLLDKAGKAHLFHKNKVARLKSRLTKFISRKGSLEKPAAPKRKKVAKTTKKTAPAAKTATKTKPAKSPKKS